jgi:hypothetical protein
MKPKEIDATEPESLRGLGRRLKRKLGLGAVELVRQLREEET